MNYKINVNYSELVYIKLLTRYNYSSLTLAQTRGIRLSTLMALILTFLFLSPTRLKALDYYSIETWPYTSKLPQSTVIDVYQDSHGLLWITNLEGLTLFDGTKFFHFRPHNKVRNYLSSTNIIKVVEGPQGDIFAVTRDKGVQIFDTTSQSFRPIYFSDSDKKVFDRVSEGTISKDELIWLGYENGSVLSFNLTNSQRRFFNSILTSRVSSIAEIPGIGILVVDADGNSVIISSSDDQITNINVGNICEIQNSDIVVTTVIGINKIWIGTRGHGLYILDLGNRNCKKFVLSQGNKNYFSEPYIQRIKHDPSKGIFWVATDRGLYLIDKNSAVTHFDSIRYELPSSEIISLTLGSNSILWIGTYRGLAYLLPSKFEYFDKRSHSKLSSITSIKSLSQNELLIGTYNGLLVFDTKQETHEKIQTLYPNANFLNEQIMSINVDSDRIWVGYRSMGLESYDRKLQKIIRFSRDGPRKLSSNSISSILSTKQGNVLVGTHGGGLNLISAEGHIEQYSIGNNRIIMLKETRNNIIWVGTEDGLFHFAEDSGRVKKIDVSHLVGREGIFSEPLVWSLAETPKGNYWLGTIHHGILFWQTENGKSNESDELNIQPISNNSLSPKTIYAIESDSEGNAWCSTNYGLVKIDSVTQNLTRFSKHHGLHENEYEYGVSHADSVGRMYFGGNQGYTAFNPKDTEQKLPPPAVSIREIITPFGTIPIPIDYSDHSDKSSIIISHRDYFVTFSFSVLDFLDPENNQYRYKLENFDPEWIENSTRNTATYTNLPAGDYVLKVQGANAAGVWNREGTSIRVKVLPPPWLTWWAYLCYGALTVLLVWMTKRVYDSYMYRKNAKRLEIEVYETREKADDDFQEQLESQDELIKSMYRHNVETLGLISEYINAQSRYSPVGADTDSARNGNEGVIALTLLEQCLFFHENQLGADLHRYTDILVEELLPCANIDQESITTINQVNSALIPVQLASQVAVVVYELLKNSLEHAFDPHSHANFIQIDFDLQRDADQAAAHYVLSISDNGKGIPQTNNTSFPTGTGLRLVGDIAEKLHADLEISAGQGTHITLRIPWGA